MYASGPVNDLLELPFSATHALIAASVAVSLPGFWALRRQEHRDTFLFIPYEVKRGKKLVGAVLSVIAFAISVISIPLLLDRPEANVFTAITTSIEAVKTNGPRWEFAFARRTSGGLEGRLDGKVVWNARRFPQMGSPSGVNRGVVEALNLEGP